MIPQYVIQKWFDAANDADYDFMRWSDFLGTMPELKHTDTLEYDPIHGDPSGGGATADNGLTELSGNIQLGGTLLASTDIETAGNQMRIIKSEGGTNPDRVNSISVQEQITLSSYEDGVGDSGIAIGPDQVVIISDTYVTIQSILIALPYIPVYANEAAAVSGGLLDGCVYRTSTGELRIKLPSV